MDLITIINAISSIGLLILTWALMVETQLLREAETEPDISVYLDFDDELSVELVVKNDGRGAAADITFEFDDQRLPRPIGESREFTKLSDIGLLGGLSFLAPGQILRSYFFDFSEYEGAEPKFVAPITCRYRGRGGKKHVLQTTLDMSPFVHVNRAAQNERLTLLELRRIADELALMRENAEQRDGGA